MSMRILKIWRPFVGRGSAKKDVGKKTRPEELEQKNLNLRANMFAKKLLWVLTNFPLDFKKTAVEYIESWNQPIKLLGFV